MNPRQGAERLLFALILIIFGAAVRGGEKKFPLEIAVSFSPVICGDRVHLFAAEEGTRPSIRPKTLRRAT